MINIAYQPLTKKYSSPVTSRSFCIPYFCYILTIILPITILINLQYSWPEFNRILVTPNLQYYGYQLSCFDEQSGDIIYNTNIREISDGENFGKSYNNKVQVSILPSPHTESQTKINVNLEVYKSKLKSCTANIYITTKIKGKQTVSSISQIPINIFVNNYDDQYLSQATIKGFLDLKSNSAIPQSSIISINQSNLFYNKKLQGSAYEYPFNNKNAQSMFDKITIAGVYNNITLFPTYDTTYQKLKHISSSSGSLANNFFQLSAEFAVNKTQFLVQASLIEKLREFIPIFIFLAIATWKCMVQPLVEWMFVNKVYSAKLTHFSKDDRRFNDRKVKKE